MLNWNTQDDSRVKRGHPTTWVIQSPTTCSLKCSLNTLPKDIGWCPAVSLKCMWLCRWLPHLTGWAFRPLG